VDFFGAAGVEAELAGAFSAPVRLVALAAGLTLFAAEISRSTSFGVGLRRFLVALLGELDDMTLAGSVPDSSHLGAAV
jgi:hypothetical protein